MSRITISSTNILTTFSQAATRANLTSGENLPISLGKISKFIATTPGLIVDSGTTTTYGGTIYTAGTGCEIFNDSSNKVAGDYSHAEGFYTKALGTRSHAEGNSCIATGGYSHAEGQNTVAGNGASHAEGEGTSALGYRSHAEGLNTIASDFETHAEGNSSTASGSSSHAEGYHTAASGAYSHSEGFYTTASGQASHAEGYYTTASGRNSHASGLHTEATENNSMVIGKYNDVTTTDRAFIIGNGRYDSESEKELRSNAFSIDWEGKIYVGNSTTGVDVSTLITSDDAISAVYGKGTDITASSGNEIDLDDYKTVGVYNLLKSGVNYLYHYPTREPQGALQSGDTLYIDPHMLNGGRLEVRTARDVNKCAQIFYPDGLQGKYIMFQRYYSYNSSTHVGTWGDWKASVSHDYIYGESAAAIDANDDLHSEKYMRPGVYISKTSAVTDTLDNCPVSRSGFRLVTTVVGVGDDVLRVRHDLYKTTVPTEVTSGNTNQVWTESYTSANSWSTWRLVSAGMDTTPTENSIFGVESGGVYAAIADHITIDDVYGGGTRIPSDADIDSATYRVPGVYYVASGDTGGDAPTINGLPYTGAGGRLVVTSTGSSSYIFQDYCPRTLGTNRSYRRFYNNGTWSEWATFRSDKCLKQLVDESYKNLVNPLKARGYSTQWSYFPITKGGITYTLNDNGSITTSGTATATTLLRIPVTLESGRDYVIAGCPEGGSSSSYALQIRKAGSDVYDAVVYGGSEIFTASQTDYDVVIRYSNGTTAGETFTPFVCPVSKWDVSTNIIPYKQNTVEITEALVDLIDNGPKNIIENRVTSSTKNGITATTNADGSITISGKDSRTNPTSDFVLVSDLYNPSATTSFTSNIKADKTKTYICPSTGNTLVRLQALGYNTSSDYATLASSDANVTFTPVRDYIVFRIFVKAGSDFTTNQFTLYPMICEKTAWDISQKFVPYRPSYQEMYERLVALENAT